MKKLILTGAVIAVVFTGAARAEDTPPDFVFFDAQIAALQHRIDGDVAGNSLKPEALQDLQGKQEELVNQETKLKQAGKLTTDEKSAMALSIREQQKRLDSFSQPPVQHVKHVDPSSQPAQTYVEPNGTTISGGTSNSAKSGIVHVDPGTVPVIHAPLPQE